MTWLAEVPINESFGDICQLHRKLEMSKKPGIFAFLIGLLNIFFSLGDQIYTRTQESIEVRRMLSSQDYRLVDSRLPAPKIREHKAVKFLICFLSPITLNSHFGDWDITELISLSFYPLSFCSRTFDLRKFEDFAIFEYLGGRKKGLKSKIFYQEGVLNKIIRLSAVAKSCTIL